MGVVNYPALHQYWSKNWPFQTPTFSSIMSRDRFLLLLKFLHLTDNRNQVPRGSPGHDRLFKLRSFMSALITQFKLLYRRHRGRYQSMIASSATKAASLFCSTCLKKTQKWGMKVCVLADAKTAYTWNWDLYSGKEESPSPDSLATRVVLCLVEGLQNMGHHVYFDNFYTSPGKKV